MHKRLILAVFFTAIPSAIAATEGISAVQTFISMPELVASDFTEKGREQLASLNATASPTDILRAFPDETRWHYIQGCYWWESAHATYKKIMSHFEKAEKQLYWCKADALLPLPPLITLTSHGLAVYHACGKAAAYDQTFSARDIAWSLLWGKAEKANDFAQTIPQYPQGTIEIRDRRSTDIKEKVGEWLYKIIQRPEDIESLIAAHQTVEQPAMEPDSDRGIPTKPARTIKLDQRPLVQITAGPRHLAANLALLNKFLPEPTLTITEHHFTKKGIELLSEDDTHVTDPTQKFAQLVRLLLSDESFWSAPYIYIPTNSDEYDLALHTALSPFSVETDRIKQALKNTTPESTTTFKEGLRQITLPTTALVPTQHETLTPTEQSILATFKELEALRIPYSTADIVYSLLTGTVTKAPLELLTTDTVRQALQEPLSYTQIRFCDYLVKKHPESRNAQVIAWENKALNGLRTAIRLTATPHSPEYIPLMTSPALTALALQYTLMGRKDEMPAPRALAQLLAPHTDSSKGQDTLYHILPETPSTPPSTITTPSTPQQPKKNKLLTAGLATTATGSAWLTYLLSNQQTRTYSTDYFKQLFSHKHRAAFNQRSPLYKELSKNYGRKTALAILISLAGVTLSGIGLK